MKKLLKRYARDFAVRQQARDRLPGWLKAILVPTILVSVFGLATLLGTVGFQIHDALHPALAKKFTSEGSMAAIFLGSFATSIAPGLMSANYILWIIRPIRRALDLNAVGVPGASFNDASRGLLKVGRLTVPIGLAILAFGVIDPFN